MTRAWLYDGRSAVRRLADLFAEAGKLRIEAEGGEVVELTPEVLVHLETRNDAEIYGRVDVQGWRLGIERPIDPDVGALLPRKRIYGGVVDRIGLPRALIAFGAVAAGVLFIGYSAPSWLAPFVPPSVEKKIGDALVGDFGGKFCNGAGGQAGLDKLTSKLSARPGALNVRVVNVKMVNAAALPGGNIVIFRELIQEAEGPEEVAGILGHEIAHVEERHVTEAMIRELGFGLLVAMFGGTTGTNVDTLMSASYSRDAEREADERALEALRRANLSPAPTAEFFARLGKAEARLGPLGRGLEYVSSHPLSTDREKRFRDSAAKGQNYAAALTKDEWDALFSICHNKPSA